MQLVVGLIARPHGVRGEVVVEVTTDEPGDRFRPGVALATDPAEAGPLTIEAVRPHQGRLIIAFEGSLDRQQADLLRGVKLCVDSDEVSPSGDPDEFNDFELIGLAAIDADGRRLGEVIRVNHGPGADLLVVRLGSGDQSPAGGRSDQLRGRDALVPFVKAIVPEVDVPGGRLVITPPEGLFDL